MQKSLDLSQPQLQAQGIRYVELSEFRRLYTRPLLHDNHPEPVAASVYDGPGVVQRLIFDENIPALAQHALGPKRLYPHAAERALRLARHLNLRRPRLVLGVRSFASFLPSLYCETLKATPFQRFEAFCRTPLAGLSWSDLLARLAVAFPGSDLLVYTAEGLRGQEAQLLSEMTGLAPAAFTLLGGVERQGFSQAAITALETLQATRPVLRADVPEMNRRHPRGPGVAGYMPWTLAERASLDALYAADLARLRSQPGLRLIEG